MSKHFFNGNHTGNIRSSSTVTATLCPLWCTLEKSCRTAAVQCNLQQCRRLQHVAGCSLASGGWVSELSPAAIPCYSLQNCISATAFTLHTAHCKLQTTHCTLHISIWSLHTAYCTMHSSHCTLETAHCTLLGNLTSSRCRPMTYPASCSQCPETSKIIKIVD